MNEKKVRETIAWLETKRGRQRKTAVADMLRNGVGKCSKQN